MHLSIWHLARYVAIPLIAAAFALLPLMAGAEANPKLSWMIHAAHCSGDHMATMAGSQSAQVSSDGNTHLCGHTPAQKAACCLGASCPMVQMVELTTLVIPLPGIATEIKSAISPVAGQGLRLAPAPKPPRQFI